MLHQVHKAMGRMDRIFQYIFGFGKRNHIDSRGPVHILVYSR